MCGARRVRGLGPWLVALGLLAESRVARAYETRVDASFDAQYYSLSSPWGEPLIRRRRYTQTLGLYLSDIQGEPHPRGPALNFVTRLRLDADFGVRPGEINPDRVSFVPGLEEAPLDLMYAYLEGRRYAGGHLDFRVGRQYTVDALGFWSFDGGLVRLNTPVYLSFEAFAGFEQRGGLPLSTGRFESQGVYRGNRDDLERLQYLAYLEQERLAPAFGAAVESSGVHFFHSRLSYRKVINRDVVNITMFPEPGGGSYTVAGDRTSSERLGYSGRLDLWDFGSISGSAVYDFYNQVLAEYAAGVEWFASSKVTIGADGEYYLPTFDADSIFNWFTHSGMVSALGRADVRFSRRLHASLRGGVKWFTTEGDPETFASDFDREKTATLIDYVGDVAARYRWTDGSVGLNGMAEIGERARRVGGDVSMRHDFDNGLYDTLVVLSVYDWSDALRPTRDATSVSYVLGAGVSPGLRLFGTSRLGVEWEHAVNRLVGQRFRMLATLDLSVFQ